jgi:hypothetical protein
MIGYAKDFVRSFLKHDGGSPAVEFAIIAPMLLLMATGVIDFGMTVRAKSEVEAAARAALQKGFGNMWDTAAIALAGKDALSLDPAVQASLSVESFASCYCDGTLTGSGEACTKDTTCGGGGYPDFYLTVNVVRHHEMLLDYYVFPREITLTGSATARAQP